MIEMRGPGPGVEMTEEDAAQNWLVESLRLTAFTRTPPPAGEQAWWEDVAGSQPPNSNLRRELAQQHQEGPFGPGRLMLALQPSRIDWTLVASSPSDPAPALLTLGSLSDAFTTFGPVRAWLERADLPPVQRLAFGAVLHLPVPSSTAGYEALMRLVPGLPLDTPGITDVLFQVNRPRPSAAYTAAMLNVNRLTNWSVTVIRALSLEVSGKGLRSALGLEQMTCRLELDINTDAAFDGVLDRAQLLSVLDELVNLGLEIARMGDHP